jgi:ABC-2 type transport system permease protein
MYAGELIWRERDTQFDQIHDALPFRSWIDTLSKFIALAAAEFFLLTVVLVCGLLSQIMAGYFHFELLQYCEELYLIVFSQVMISRCWLFSCRPSFQINSSATASSSVFSSSA